MKQSKTHIFYTKVGSQLPRDIYQQYLFRLPAIMQSQNARYVQWQDRQRHLLGKLLLIDLLKLFGLDHTALNHIRYNEYGRPFIGNEIDFNISHSGNFVIGAIAAGIRIGIDVEEKRPVDFRDYHNVMTREQWKIILSADDPLHTFFTFWTIKESVIKADSRGLFIPLENLCFVDNAVRCTNQVWYPQVIDIDPGYCTSLALNVPDSAPGLNYKDYSKDLVYG